MDERPRAVLYDLPLGVREMVREMVCESDDGSTVVLLNSRYNRETNQASYLHALAHVENGDLDKELDVGQVEKERHSK